MNTIRARRASATLAALAVAGLVLPPPERAAGEEIDAAQVYLVRCAFCHGDEGAGDGLAAAALDPKPTDFTSPAFWKERSKRQVRESIADGKPGTAMVPFRNTLKAAEIDALVGYLRSLANR